MRPLSAALIKAQKQPEFNSLWKLVLTKDGNSYTYERDVISRLTHLESDYNQVADVVINDPDNEVAALALQGYKGVLSYGLVLPNGAEEYSATAPLWLIPQQLHSLASGNYSRLSLGGVFNQMNADRASAKYEPDTNNTDTIQTIVNAIIGATLSCFSHCKAYEVVWDSIDDIAYSYQPKDMFAIPKRGTRTASIKKLLSWTNLVAIIKADGKIHIFQPTITGTDYDYEFELAELDVGKHTFFAKTYRKRVVIPNYIVVESHESHTNQYSGIALDAVSIAALADSDTGDNGEKRDFITLRLSSDAQALAIAEAIRDKYSLDSERGSGKFPMNLGQEQYDYVNIIDGRTGDNVVGNVGYIKRVCQPSPDIEKGFVMSFGFGKMMEYNPLGLAPASSPLGVGMPDFNTLVEALNETITNLNNLWESHIGLQQMFISLGDYLERLRITPSQFGFRTDWESLDGWDITGCTGTGTATTDKDGLTLNVGATPASIAKILTNKRGGITLQFAKESVFKTVMAVSSVADDVVSWAILGDKDIGSGYGFKLIGTKLYGYVRKIGVEQTVELIDNFNADQDYILQAHYTPEVSVAFFVDNEYKGEETIVLPTSDNEGIQFQITTTTTANAKLYDRTAQVYIDFLSGHSATGLWLIDADGTLGQIARDASGVLWCVYLDGDGVSLKCRQSGDNGETWSEPENIVTESYAPEFDMAMDSGGIVHVVYVVRTGASDSFRTLYHIYRDTIIGWTTKEDIIGSEKYIKYPRIAIDSSDDVHAIYHEGTLGSASADYVKRTSGVWGSPYTLETHTYHNMWSQDIAIDENDNVHVAYISRRGRSVYHREYTTSWQAEDTLFTTDDFAVDQFGVRIAINSSGQVHVVWVGHNTGGTYPLKHNLRYCKGITGSFTAVEELTDVDYHQVSANGQSATAFDLDIAINFLDKIDIVWRSLEDGFLRHLLYDGSWGSVATLFDFNSAIFDILWAWHPEFYNVLSNSYVFTIGVAAGLSLYRS